MAFDYFKIVVKGWRGPNHWGSQGSKSWRGPVPSRPHGRCAYVLPLRYFSST